MQENTGTQKKVEPRNTRKTEQKRTFNAKVLKIVGRERLKTFPPLRRTGTRLEGFQPFQPYKKMLSVFAPALKSLFTCPRLFFLTQYVAMKDNLIKGHLKGIDVAFSYAQTTNTVREIIIGHDCDPVAAHLLGRALTGALLSAAVLPTKHRLNVCWKYQGALRTIVVDAGQDGTVRGFISPAQFGSMENSGDALYGNIGNLQTVVSHNEKVLSSSTTPVSLHDVAKDLAYAHCISDQVETGLSVMIGFNPDPENPLKICRGFMIQALPGTDLERLDRIRRRMDEPLFRERLGSADDLSIETLLQTLIAEESDIEGTHTEACPAPKFVCPCSREKMSAVVRTLPISERMELVKKNEDIEIRCQFCNTLYALSIDDCIAAWNEHSTQRH